jgi:hypothetical protein
MASHPHIPPQAGKAEVSRMHRTRASAAVAAALLTLSLCIPGAVGAAGGAPADAANDPAETRASRIAAIARIVLAADARLERIILAYPPNPCALVTEPTGLCDAAVAVVAGYAAIGASVAEACGGSVQRAAGRPGTAADADAPAAASDASGTARRLAAIARVLRGADARLEAILPPGPVTPGSPEADALDGLSRAVHDGGRAAAGWIGGAFDWPPNPCARAGG